QDLQTALVIGPADLGETHLARAAIEQADAESFLQRLDVSGHHARRNAERARRRRKASALDHLHKGGHAGHAVHSITLCRDPRPLVTPDMIGRPRLNKPGPAITFPHIFGKANGAGAWRATATIRGSATATGHALRPPASTTAGRAGFAASTPPRHSH